MATYSTRRPESGPATATLIELVGVEKVYRSGKLEYPALRGVDLSIRRRRDGRDRRAFGQRQVDDHQHDHRHRSSDRRGGDGRRRADRSAERGAAGLLARRERGDRVSVLPAAADADRA